MGVIEDFGLLEQQVAQVGQCESTVASLTSDLDSAEKTLADARTAAKETQSRLTASIGALLPPPPAPNSRVRVS